MRWVDLECTPSPRAQRVATLVVRKNLTRRRICEFIFDSDKDGLRDRAVLKPHRLPTCAASRA